MESVFAKSYLLFHNYFPFSSYLDVTSCTMINKISLVFEETRISLVSLSLGLTVATIYL